jgi:hypothetical protein
MNWLKNPPVKPLIDVFEAAELGYPFCSTLHHDNAIRYRFYRKLLVPAGHAIEKHINTSGWGFSHEYFIQLRDNLQELQAWTKLLQ